MLDITDLSIKASDSNKTMLRDVHLHIPKGHIVIIKGMNGTGKSTLLKTIMGHQGYTICSGNINFKGNTINHCTPDDIFKKGIFMSWQEPIGISGLKTIVLLKRVYDLLFPNSQYEDFISLVSEASLPLYQDKGFLYKDFNIGNSGGEKKRNEILQMQIFQREFSMLDEIDANLDKQAREILVQSILHMKSLGTSFLYVTHSDYMIDAISPDEVYMMENQTLVKI